MRVKKYHANSMPEAMSLIRADLGPDAIILHSQEVRLGGWSGWFRPSVLEVTAAVDKDLRDFPYSTRTTADATQQIQTELSALKLALNEVIQARSSSSMSSTNRRDAKESPPPLDEWYRQLLQRGVASHLARQILHIVADELNQWALENSDILNHHLHWQLERRLPSSTFTLAPDWPSVFFIVGPTGVGKTTTIAKLAACLTRSRFPQSSAPLSKGERKGVLIITIDTFRVAAIPQIVTFGEILGAPVEVAYTPEHLATLIEANNHYRLILVDTPGRSQYAATDIAELADYLAVVPAKVVHLALAASTRYEDMRQAVEAFRPMSLDGLILTKIDEAISLGPAYTLACETSLPLSYFTTGQHVPEDIEVATAKRMIDSIIGPTSTSSLRSTKE